MKPRYFDGLLLLLTLAAIGAAFLYFPPRILEQYRTAREMGEAWGYAYLGTVAVGGTLLLGVLGTALVRLILTGRRKKQRKEGRARNPSAMTAAEREREIEENLAEAEQLRADPQLEAEIRARLEPLLRQVEAKRSGQTLEIVAFGTISSGKSSVLNALAGREVFAADAAGGTTIRRSEVDWPGSDRVRLVDTPGLGEVEGASRAAVAAEAARDADLVLLVLDGPLRDTEFALLEQLRAMEKRILICLNKQDWYSPEEGAKLRGQVVEQLRGTVAPDDVVNVQSRAGLRPRTRVLPDGREVEELVEVPPEIGPLAARMMAVVARDGRDLLLANLLLQSRGLVENARRAVRDDLDRRAREIVDRYAWGAGGAAALAPWPLLDLAAGVTISSKMVFDLAQVYRQEIDLDTVIRMLAQMAKVLLATLGTAAAGPAIAALAASLLKTVPGVGTLAGGLLQGVVQALVTRWIGAVFIEYFRNHMQEPEGGLTALARRKWNELTTAEQLYKLVQAARRRSPSAQDDPDE